MTTIGIDARLAHYRIGGITTYARELIKALAALNTSHKFITFESRRARRSIADQFESAKLWTPPHHRLERWTLSLELLRYGLDVFHSPDFIPPQRGAKYHVITVHDLTFLHYPEHKDTEARRYYNQQINRAVKHADHILAVSASTKRDLVDMLDVPTEKITVQPHGVNINQYISPTRGPFGGQMFENWLYDQAFPQKYILHVGTLEPRKNIPALLHAYTALRDRRPDSPALLLVGRPGWLFDETMSEIRRLQGQGVPIVVREHVNDGELTLLYTGAEMLVMPSFYEGFGLPVLEAMACGTVVIASDVAALPEVVGDAGLLIDPQDPETLLDAMERALTDEVWRRATRQRGIQRARQFTWEKSARIALEVYEGVVRG